MSYCSPDWVSAYNYQKMIDVQLGRVTAARVIAGDPEIIECDF